MSERTKKILWIEDDYRLLRGLTIPLEERGYKIIPAMCYNQAITELSDNKEDLSLILLDLILPYSLEEAVPPKMSEEEYEYRVGTTHELVENGMNLLRNIKNERKIEVPIVVLSIVTNINILQELEGYGVVRLNKDGLLPNKLEEVVLDVLRG